MEVPATRTLAPFWIDKRAVSALMPPSTSMSSLAPERLTAKTGVDGHDEQDIDLVEKPFDRFK